MKLCALCLGSIVLLSVATAQAESLTDMFRAANEASFAGDFATAAQRYQKLVDAGVQDPDVFFNLGLAHARSAKLGAAVLNFERAMRLSPGDPEIESALTTARTVLGERRSARQGEATVQARPPLTQALVQPYAENTLALLLLVFDLLLFGLLLVRMRLRGELARTALAVAAFVSALGIAASGSALALKRGAVVEGRPGIVLHEGAALREGPDPRAKVRGAAYEGESARVLQREGAFLRVRTERGPQGWMHGSDVGVITPD